MTHALTPLPWHESVLRRLWGLAQSRKLGHAWLFSGMHGSGKQAFAHSFAAALLCAEPGQGRACGRCQSCHLMARGNHPDWRPIQPEKRLIVVDQIRESIGYASNTSHRGGYKILCLAPAEAMNLNAANALLKLLEEPPAQTLLILVSHQPGLLLPTLRSRCQHLKLPLPDQELAAAWLEQQGFSGDAALMLQRANGAPLRALAMTDSGVIAEHETILSTVQEVLGGTSSPVRAAQSCEKISIEATIDYLMLCIGNLLRSLQAETPIADPELRALGQALPEGGNRRRKLMALHRLHQAHAECRRIALSGQNPNPQLLLEQIFTDWSKLRRLQGAARH